MSEELKPCPFCGGEARSHLYVRDGGKVQCTNHKCWASTTQFNPDGTEKAIKAWNTRTPSPQWQDIATAPKDGTEILLWGRCERGGQFFAYDHNVGWWSDAETSSTGDAGWQARDLPIEPKFWMPLPPAPSDRDAAQRKAVGFEAEGQQPGPKASPIPCSPSTGGGS